MSIQFICNKDLLKTKNAKREIVPMRGDLVSFVRDSYYVVVSIEHHYENEIIIIRLDKV